MPRSNLNQIISGLTKYEFNSPQNPKAQQISELRNRFSRGTKCWIKREHGQREISPERARGWRPGCQRACGAPSPGRGRSWSARASAVALKNSKKKESKSVNKPPGGERRRREEGGERNWAGRVWGLGVRAHLHLGHHVVHLGAGHGVDLSRKGFARCRLLRRHG